MQSCRLIGIIEKTCFQREWLSVDAKACFVIDASKMYSYHKTVFDARLIESRGKPRYSCRGRIARTAKPSWSFDVQ